MSRQSPRIIGYGSEHWRNATPIAGSFVDKEALAADDATHVEAVKRLGGFPRAVVDYRGRTEWIGHDGKPWQQALRRKAARARR